MIPLIAACDPCTCAIEALDGWFHTPFAELPAAIQARVEYDVFLPVAELWDRWTAEERRAIYRDPDRTPPIDGPLWEHPDDVASGISTWEVAEIQPRPPATIPMARDRPSISDSMIKSRLAHGDSITQIHQDTKASKNRIRMIKKDHGIENATPGPKPKRE